MIKAQNFKKRWEDIKDDVLAGMEQIHINEKVVNAYFTNQVEEKLKQVSNRKYALQCLWLPTILVLDIRL